MQLCSPLWDFDLILRRPAHMQLLSLRSTLVCCSLSEVDGLPGEENYSYRQKKTTHTVTSPLVVTFPAIAVLAETIVSPLMLL
eukprot:6480093-Amphidinium_carterae.2